MRWPGCKRSRSSSAVQVILPQSHYGEHGHHAVIPSPPRARDLSGVSFRAYREISQRDSSARQTPSGLGMTTNANVSGTLSHTICWSDLQLQGSASGSVDLQLRLPTSNFQK